MTALSPLNVPIPSINELSQNAARLLQQSLVQASQSSNTAALSATDLELARSNVRALAFVQAAGVHGAYRYLRDFIARQAIPIKSAGEFLDGWLATYGMSRKVAAAASGLVTGTGVAATLLTAGTMMQDDAGRQYMVTADVAVAGDGTITATVQALMAGAAGNAVGGLALQLLSPTVGIDAAFVTALPLGPTGGLGGGADLESDDLAIYRLQQRLANEPMGGCPADYARWALTQTGITRAWGVRSPVGPTSAGVIIMADGNVSLGLPNATQQAAVLAYIRNPLRGPPDELFVIIPTPVVVNVTLNISPDTAAIRAAVTTALKDLFFREAVPGGAIPQSHLVEVISAVTGEYNHTITVPAIVSGSTLTVPAYDRLLVLGTVTFI